MKYRHIVSGGNGKKFVFSSKLLSTYNQTFVENIVIIMASTLTVKIDQPKNPLIKKSLEWARIW